MNIRYYLRQNTTPTAEKAPYLIRVVPNGVANTGDLTADILGDVAGTDARVRMVLEQAVRRAVERARDGETVDLGALRLKANIPGTYPCEDSPFDIDATPVELLVYADGELADAAARLTPVRMTDSEVNASIRVSNEMDVTSEEFATVYGTNPFVILGNGITLDQEGEYVKALDRKTGEVVATATVTGVTKGQRATCKFGTALDAGPYSLEIATRGLVELDTPRIFSKPVTAKAVVLPPSPDPKIVSLDGSEADWAAKATRFGHEEDETYDTWVDTNGTDMTLHIVPDDVCTFWFEDQSGTRHEGTCQLVNKGDDELVFKVPVEDAAALVIGDVVHFKAVLHGGVAGTAGHTYEWTSTVIEG